MDSVSFRWGPRLVDTPVRLRAPGQVDRVELGGEVRPQGRADFCMPFTAGREGLVHPVGALEASALSLVGGPLGAVGRSLWEAVDYELRALPQGGGVADRLAPLAGRAALTVALTMAGSAPSSVAVLAEMDRLLLPEAGPEGGLLLQASQNARDYLQLKDVPIARERVAPPTRLPGPPARPGCSEDVAAVDVGAVAWRGVGDYVESRLGPVAWLLDEMGPADRVRFSNLSLERSQDGLPAVVRAERLDLPVSSWSKSIDLLTHEDGSRTMVLGEFPGRVLMRHFQLLVRHRLGGRDEAPALSVVEDPSAYDYDGMAALFRARRAELAGVEVLAVGYDHAFRKEWADRLERSVEDPSSPWRADLYRLEDGRRMAVLSTPASFHGEILGQSVRRAVLENPAIRTVFAGGSAGSLHAREPYSFVFPQVLPGKENALGPRSERLAHASVLSPLAETPAMLRSAQAGQVTTVDLEMGPLAQALADLDVELGVGLLATDFPAGPTFERTELAQQDPARKYARLRDYTEAVRLTLAGARPGEHPLEQALGANLRDLSARNLAREWAWLGDLSPDEARLVERLKAAKPEYSFRMTTNRLRRLLEDGAVLSTAQVASLKGAPVKPYTPPVEDALYGALDYTFGAVGFGRGDDRYGEVRVVLKPETVQARSFATYRSGWAALESARRGDLASAPLSWEAADPALLEAARRRLGEWVVIPEHYTASMAAYAVETVRAKGPEVLRSLLEAPPEEFPRLLEQHGLGFLEGRIRGALSLQDLERVELPPDAPLDVVRALAAQGLSQRQGH